MKGFTYNRSKLHVWSAPRVSMSPPAGLKYTNDHKLKITAHGKTVSNTKEQNQHVTLITLTSPLVHYPNIQLLKKTLSE